MILFVLPLALLLAQAALLTPVHGNPKVVDHTILASICAGKKVALTRSSELSAIVAQMHKLGPKCPDDLKMAIIELNEVITFSERQDACSLDKVGEIKKFYEKYLAAPSKIQSEHPGLFKWLKNFFLSYGMQVSNLCKKNMVKVLKAKGKISLQQDDFDRVGRLSSKHGPVDQLLNDISEPAEIVLPVDLTALLKPKERMHEKVYLQSSVTEEIEDLKDVCLRRFRPIYEHLILPLNQLASIGFDYTDAHLKRDIEHADVAAKAGLWSRIVFLCEALMLVEPVGELPYEEGKQASLKASGEAKGKHLVRMLTREEAEAIKERLGRHRYSGRRGDLELLVYKPGLAVKPDDLVVDDSKSELKSAVSSFSSRKRSIKCAKKKMLRRGLILMREYLKHRRVGVVASNAFKESVKKVKSNKKMEGEMDEINSVLEENLKSLSLRAYQVDPVSAKDVVLAFLVTLLGSGMVASFSFTVAKVALGFIAVVAGLSGMVG